MTATTLRSRILSQIVGPHWVPIPPLPGRTLLLNGCWHGLEIWLQMLLATAWHVPVTAAHIRWHEARHAARGASFLVIGKRDTGRQHLYVIEGQYARLLRLTSFVDVPGVHLDEYNGDLWQQLREVLFPTTDAHPQE